MLETEQVKRAENFHRKLDETKRRAFEQEVLRLEKETELRGNALAKMLQLKDNHLFEELTKEAETTRQREEELLRKREADILTRLKDEHIKKKMRRAEEERLRREEEQEKTTREQQLKEEARNKAEEERRRWQEQMRRQEEEQLRIIEAERRQREEEARRVSEDEQQQQEMQSRRQEDDRLQVDAERRQRELEDERLRQEEAMRLQREEFRKKEEERLQREAEQKRLGAELRQQEEENLRKREEEERIRKEAEEKLRLEEELRRQIEERHRQEEELKRQEEELKRRQTEALHRLEQEKQAPVVDERESRIQELLNNAESFYAKGNYEHALVEVAKALVNDPSNEVAIQLEKKIKEIQGIEEPEEKESNKPARNRHKRRELKPRFQKPEKRKSILSRPLYAIAVVALIAVVVVVAIQLKKKIFPTTITVAILPWTSTTNISEENIDGSSLAEEVAKQFQQFKQSSVMGYSSVYGMTHTSTAPEQALFRLGCSYVLQGTLTKSALGVSINLRLVDSLGSVRWSEHYDRSLATLPSLPAEIAGHVAIALDLPRDRSYTQLTTTTNPDAYALYLRAIELLHRHTRPSMRNAFEILHQAIEHDPSFAQALSAASLCLTTMVEENWVEPDSALDLARDFAEKAIKANSSLSDGYTALGKVLTMFRDYTGAAEQYALALKYSPTNSIAYLNKGKNYLRRGNYKDAIEALTRAYDLNPRDAEVLQSLGFAYQLSGDAERGAWYHQTALYFVPDSTDYLIGPIGDAILLDPDLSLSQSARVISACEHRIVQNPDDYSTIYRLSRMLQVTGKRIEGTTLLDKLEKALRLKLKTEPLNGNAMIYLALTLTRTGKFPEATVWGQKAMEVSPSNPMTCYRLAQMYSLQMYSHQRKKIDEKKKDDATKTLKQALRLNYRLEELTNADFYNMYEHGNLDAVIASNHQ